MCRSVLNLKDSADWPAGFELLKEKEAEDVAERKEGRRDAIFEWFVAGPRRKR